MRAQRELIKKTYPETNVEVTEPRPLQSTVTAMVSHFGDNDSII